MNNHKHLIDLIEPEKSFLNQIKEHPDKNRLKDWSRNFELILKQESRSYPEIYYFFRYREITDNFEVDINNDLKTLEEIENYLEEKSDNLPSHINDLFDRSLNFLENSEKFDSKNLKRRDFEIWENDVGNFLEMSFIDSFINDFRKLTESECKTIVISDGKERIRDEIPVVWSHLANIRSLLLEIIFKLGKNDERIINMKKPAINKIRCFLLDRPECSEDISPNKNWIFEAYNYSDKDTENTINNINNTVLSQFDLIPKSAGHYRRSKDFMCKICQLIQESKYFLADLSDYNKNVILETGIAIGLSKKVFIISRHELKEMSDLIRSEIIIYSKDNIDKLKLNFISLLKNELH